MSIEKQVGLFFLASLILLGILIELSEDWRPFEQRLHYHANFDSAIGISVGDPVRMAGVEVGKITAISIEDSQVRIDFYTTDSVELVADSTASIRQINLLGGQFLGISFGTRGQPVLPPGSELMTEETANIDQLITNLDRNQEKVFDNLGDLIVEIRGNISEMVERLSAVVRRIDNGEGTLGLLVNNPSLYDNLNESLVSLKSVLTRLENGDGTIGKLINDPSLYDDAAGTVANLRSVSADLQQGTGTLGLLLKDEQLYNQLNIAAARLDSILAKTDDNQGTLGRLVNEPGLYDEFYEAVARLNSIVGKIDEGQGTFGRLINEDDLYREAKTTLNKIEKTVDGMSDSGPLSGLGVVIGTFF
ncbi:MAG: MlaD family protein [Desulfuromonadales bacterium]|nr:MlaD family protein [Desulfuromonadales bacterium]